MSRFICKCLFLVSILIFSGCASGPGSFGWVLDSDQYYQMSGYSVQAPSGSDWFRQERDEKNPNGIAFQKIQNATPRYAVHPDFTFTFVRAYGFAIGTQVPRSDDKVKEVLGQILKQHETKGGLKVENRSYDTSLGALCLAYQGRLLNPDATVDVGMVPCPIRTHSVAGYLCLHPDYDDFAVLMESRNGATVEIAPVDRQQQVDHFFQSLRFTPRNLPVSAPSKEEGRRSAG